MTIRQDGSLVLAMDISGLGDFTTVGILREPSAPLAFATRELRDWQAQSGLWTILLHAFATNISGRCIFHDLTAEHSVQTSLSRRLAMDWRISIPETGVMQALFLVNRLVSLDKAMRLFELVLQLAGKPELHPLQAERKVIF
jgi:hypothetical protein